MKKLLIVLFAFLAVATTAYAEDFPVIEERSTTMPNILPIEEVSFFTEEISIEQQLYNIIVESFITQEAEIDISSLNILYNQENFNAIFDIYCTAVYNHPEYGNLRTSLAAGNGIYNSNQNAIFYKILPKRLTDYDEQAYIESVNYALSKVLYPEMTDFEKILSIHDYLCDTISYSDPIGVDEDGNDVYADSVFTPYGALTNCDAVCQGYSLAFKLLCDYAGIDCGYAISTVQSHIWNIVQYDGYYYHLDATWDDPKMSSGKYTLHHYLLLSDDENMTRRGYTDYSWTRNVSSSCSNSGLNDTLYCKDKINPFIWRDGKFWYTDTGFYGINSTDDKYYIFLTNTEKYYQVDDNLATEVVASDYLPNHKLDCEIFPSYNGMCAIDGIVASSADLYAAIYDNGKLTDVKKIDLTFDDKGRAVASVPENAKLMLFENGTIKPIAYAR